VTYDQGVGPGLLTREVVEHGLRQGDVRTVVHRYSNGRAFEVEFVTAAGATVAVLTLELEDIRLVGSREILHRRDVVPLSA
jgi:hypothetical protein